MAKGIASSGKVSEKEREGRMEGKDEKKHGLMYIYVVGAARLIE